MMSRLRLFWLRLTRQVVDAKEAFPDRTTALQCVTCGARVQSLDGGAVWCRCPRGSATRIGISGTVYNEDRYGRPSLYTQAQR